MEGTLNVILGIVLAIPFVAFMVFLAKSLPWRLSKPYGWHLSKPYGIEDPTRYTWGAFFRDCRTGFHERSRRWHSTCHDAWRIFLRLWRRRR